MLFCFEAVVGDDNLLQNIVDLVDVSLLFYITDGLIFALGHIF